MIWRFLVVRVSLLALIAALSVSIPACGRDDQQQPQDRREAPPSPPNADVDKSTAPADESEPQMPEGARGVRASLYANQIRTRHLFDGTVTAGKIGYVAITVNVNAAATSGTNTAEPLAIGGVLVGCHPSGNQDQFMDNVTLNSGTGVITVTLAAAATAQNNFRCIVWKANALGTK